MATASTTRPTVSATSPSSVGNRPKKARMSELSSAGVSVGSVAHHGKQAVATPTDQTITGAIFKIQDLLGTEKAASGASTKSNLINETAVQINKIYLNLLLQHIPEGGNNLHELVSALFTDQPMDEKLLVSNLEKGGPEVVNFLKTVSYLKKRVVLSAETMVMLTDQMQKLQGKTLDAASLVHFVNTLHPSGQNSHAFEIEASKLADDLTMEVLSATLLQPENVASVVSKQHEVLESMFKTDPIRSKANDEKSKMVVETWRRDLGLLAQENQRRITNLTALASRFGFTIENAEELLENSWSSDCDGDINKHPADLVILQWLEIEAKLKALPDSVLSAAERDIKQKITAFVDDLITIKDTEGEEADKMAALFKVQEGVLPQVQKDLKALSAENKIHAFFKPWAQYREDGEVYHEVWEIVQEALPGDLPASAQAFKDNPNPDPADNPFAGVKDLDELIENLLTGEAAKPDLTFSQRRMLYNLLNMMKNPHAIANLILSNALEVKPAGEDFMGALLLQKMVQAQRHSDFPEQEDQSGKICLLCEKFESTTQAFPALMESTYLTHFQQHGEKLPGPSDTGKERGAAASMIGLSTGIGAAIKNNIKIFFGIGNSPSRGPLKGDRSLLGLLDYFRTVGIQTDSMAHMTRQGPDWCMGLTGVALKLALSSQVEEGSLVRPDLWEPEDEGIVPEAKSAVATKEAEAQVEEILLETCVKPYQALIHNNVNLILFEWMNNASVSLRLFNIRAKARKEKSVSPDTEIIAGLKEALSKATSREDVDTAIRTANEALEALTPEEQGSITKKIDVARAIGFAENSIESGVFFIAYGLGAAINAMKKAGLDPLQNTKVRSLIEVFKTIHQFTSYTKESPMLDFFEGRENSFSDVMHEDYKVTLEAVTALGVACEKSPQIASISALRKGIREAKSAAVEAKKDETSAMTALKDLETQTEGISYLDHLDRVRKIREATVPVTTFGEAFRENQSIAIILTSLVQNLSTRP